MSVVGRIRPLEHAPVGMELRCAGCGFPPELLDPAVVFVDYAADVHRGVLVKQLDGAAMGAMDGVFICSECLAKAALLFDPQPGKAYRDGVEELKGSLGDELAALARDTKEKQALLKAKERELQELHADRDATEALKVAAGAWLRGFDEAFEELRAVRPLVWAWERAVRGGDEWAVDELERDRQLLAKVTKKLSALTKTGTQLRVQCEQRGLVSEAGSIGDRIMKQELEGAANND